MYVELRHLRTIRAIHQAGGLARAADMLNMTQSALSHQVAGLEDQVGMELFVRRSKPMRLSAAGVRMLRAAERILPEIAALEEEFRALQSAKTGRLHIAIECHACFDWLFPVLELFRHSWPEIDVDIRAGLALEPEHLGEARGKPPILLVHGDRDNILPVDSLFDAMEGLGKAEIPCQWHLSVGTAHGIDQGGLTHGGLFLAQSFGLKTPG